jgi:hypothetical protein
VPGWFGCVSSEALDYLSASHIASTTTILATSIGPHSPGEVEVNHMTRPKVLLVDDTDAVLHMMEQSLSKEGLT